MRGEFKHNKKLKLGIKIFENCLAVGNLKALEAKRRLFTQWNHNVFPKNILSNIVENALVKSHESKIKLKVLNTMT